MLEATCLDTLVDVPKDHLRIPLHNRALFSFDKNCSENMHKADAFVSRLSRLAFVERGTGTDCILRGVPANPARVTVQMESGITGYLDASTPALKGLIIKLYCYRPYFYCRDTVMKGALALRRA